MTYEQLFSSCHKAFAKFLARCQRYLHSFGLWLVAVTVPQPRFAMPGDTSTVLGISTLTGDLERATLDDACNKRELMLQLREAINRWLAVHGTYITEIAEASTVTYRVLHNFLRGEVITHGPAPNTYRLLRDCEVLLSHPWDKKTMELLKKLCKLHNL